MYADWLDEHDQAEAAEYLRLLCESKGLQPCKQLGRGCACAGCLNWMKRFVLGEAPGVAEHLWPRELPELT